MFENCSTQKTQSRTVSYSRTEQVHIVLPQDCNQTFRLFGGRLMEWVDIVAAVVARRHSASDVITASIDRLDFLASAKLSDIIVMLGRLVYVGNTSMLVCVDTYVEDPECETISRTLVNRAYVTMVALNKEKQPMSVPRLILETDQERAEYTIGRARREASRSAPR